MGMSADQRTLARQYLADPGTSAAQSIQIENATGGTFSITYSGQTTAALAYNAGANLVQNALCALSNVGVGGIVVNDTANGGVPNSVFFAVLFTGNLANVAQAMFTVNTSLLTGPGVLAVVSQTQAGGVTAFSDDEIDLLYDQARLNFFLAIAYGYDILCGFGSKFNDYVAAQSAEKKSQIPEHLQERAQFYHQWANADRQVQPVSLVSEPPRIIAYPRMTGVPNVALSPAGSPWFWGRWVGGRGWR